MSKTRFDSERAKMIGRKLFQKYDFENRGILGPKQCYEVFSDYCFRILSLNPEPTMQEAVSMFQVLDFNRDQNVTERDFEGLAVKYLCGDSFMGPSSVGQSNLRQSNIGQSNTGKSYTQSNTVQENLKQSGYDSRGNEASTQGYGSNSGYKSPLNKTNLPPAPMSPRMNQRPSIEQVSTQNEVKRSTVTTTVTGNTNTQQYSSTTKYGVGPNQFSSSQTYKIEQKFSDNQQNNFQDLGKFALSRVINSDSNYSKKLTTAAQSRVEAGRKMFAKYDRNNSGFLTEIEVPRIIADIYKTLGLSHTITTSDVRGYIDAMDTNRDGKVSLAEFEQIILKGLVDAGVNIYE